MSLIEQVTGNKGCVTVLKELLLVKHLAIVERVFEDMLDLACDNGFSDTTREPETLHFLRELEHREIARSVQLEHFHDKKVLVRIGNNIFLAVIKSDIFVAERGFVWKLSASHPLLQAPLYVVTQLEDITSSHKHAQVPPLKLGTVRVFVKHKIFSDEVDFELSALAELIEDDRLFEASLKTVNRFNNKGDRFFGSPNIFQNFLELHPMLLERAFVELILFEDFKLFSFGVFLGTGKLSGNGSSFQLILF